MKIESDPVLRIGTERSDLMPYAVKKYTDEDDDFVKLSLFKDGDVVVETAGTVLLTPKQRNEFIDALIIHANSYPGKKEE